MQNPVNANDNGIGEDEDEGQTFPDFLLAGLQSDNTDLVIQAVHDIAVKVRQMDDIGLQETATWVLEALYSNMDDDRALGLLKQEVLVVVAVALHNTDHNNDDDDNKESTNIAITESHENNAVAVVGTPIPPS